VAVGFIVLADLGMALADVGKMTVTAVTLRIA
jgi:hypothetical protein